VFGIPSSRHESIDPHPCVNTKTDRLQQPGNSKGNKTAAKGNSFGGRGSMIGVTGNKIGVERQNTPLMDR
jgi:hypothetical protein